jgi:Flp pilus assembly protein TadG
MGVRMRSHKSFAHDARGIAAVEFALVLPVLLLMLFGSYDVSRMVMANQKVGVAAATVAELVAAQPTNTATASATISAIVAAGAVAMAPFAAASTTTTVSAIDLKPAANGTCCVATVNWSFTQGGRLRPCATTFTQTALDAAPALTSLPTAIASPPAAVQALASETAVIISDVTYAYAPIAPGIDKLLPATLHRTTYTYPRLAGQVQMATPVTPASGQAAKVC